MMATTEKTVKKLTIHKMKKKDYAQLPSKSADEMYLLTDVGGQVSEISEASADYVGEIVQYVGETNDTYTNGFFYKCVETDGVYSWTQVNVQGGGAGGDYLPLSGGTLTGVLNFDYNSGTYGNEDLITFPAHNGSLSTIRTGQGGTGLVFDLVPVTGFTKGRFRISSEGFFPDNSNGEKKLGSSANRWGTVFATRLSSTSGYVNEFNELIIPDKAGTLARLEDINAIGGDGAEGQVLTKTADGMVWQNASGGGELPDNVFVNRTTHPLSIAISTLPAPYWSDINMKDKSLAIIANRSPGTPSPIVDEEGVSISARSAGGGVGKSGVSINGNAGDYSVGIGNTSSDQGSYNIMLGYQNWGSNFGTKYGIAIGSNTGVSVSNTIQFNVSGSSASNKDANTFKVANENGNFEIMSADGTMPTDRYTTTPTDAGTYVPKLTIAEDGTATREWGAESGGAGGDYLPLSGGTLTGALGFSAGGYTYSIAPKSYNELAIKFGDVDAYRIELGRFVPGSNEVFVLGSSTRRWQNVYTTKLNNGADLLVPTEGGTLARLEDLASAGGLPDQTDNAGKFLMTDGTTASWGGDRLLQDNANFKDNGLAVGTGAQATASSTTAYGTRSFAGSQGGTAFGSDAHAGSNFSIAIGSSSKVTSSSTSSGRYAIQLGGGTNSDDNTFKVYNGVGNFELMDANGNVPRERLKNLVEVLPTEDNGYVTVKNFGNGYVEISGCKEIGTVDPSGGDTVLIEFPEGYELITPYWANVSCTSDADMFSFKAEVKTRSVHDLVIAYKNEDDSTGLDNAVIFWEVRGMLFSTLE